VKKNDNIIEIFVELLDEGTESWRSTKAIKLENGLFKILATPDYNPEDEAWAFLPEEEVALEKKNFSDGKSGMVARHSNPNVISIDMPLINKKPALRPTKALSLGNGLYEILPTPHYDPNIENWKFTPGTIVRLEKQSPDGVFTYLIPTEKTDKQGN